MPTNHQAKIKPVVALTLVFYAGAAEAHGVTGIAFVPVLFLYVALALGFVFYFIFSKQCWKKKLINFAATILGILLSIGGVLLIYYLKPFLPMLAYTEFILYFVLLMLMPFLGLLLGVWYNRRAPDGDHNIQHK